ncbi:MAG TPA: glycosyltransferase [Patescibacteria group bacterium]|nr:glycosyltransferase [Patescibacteria group bacterium]
MNIGFFTDGYLPQQDGVVTSVLESVRELERRGHTVTIVAPKFPGYTDRNKNVIRLTSFKINTLPEIRLALNLPDRGMRKIMSMDFDIIHGHAGGPVTLIGWELARVKKIPMIMTYHTMWSRYTHYFMRGKVIKPKMMEQVTKIFSNRIDHIVAPTRRVERDLKSYGVKRPISVIPSGIDVESFRSAPHGFLRKLIKNDKDPIVLFVGRLGREKSVDHLISSFRHVILEIPSARLVIVGDGVDRKKLEQMAKKLKVDKSVIFAGKINNFKMHLVYKDASVFAFASRTETQGLVVWEALASGVPVVAVDDPAYECVKDGVNGYLVKGGVSDFANKITSILKDSELHEKMSIAASESVEKYSVTETVNSLENIYFDLLEEHNKESVRQISVTNERAENAFIINSAFWATILLVRTATLLFHQGYMYPTINILGQSFFHSEIGIFLLLLAMSQVVNRRKPGFFTLILFGAATALIIDEVWAVLLGHATIRDYWSAFNLMPIITAGVVSGLFTTTNLDERPQFYINTREQKHENPEKPKVSVVIPAYNEGQFIAPTLKSLLNQSYKNFEIIVVDNNSTDDTRQVAAHFGARVVLERKKGVAAARQAGFLSARGEIIASTDADSVVPENWLSKIVDKYDHEDIVGLAGVNNLYSGAVAARAFGRFLFMAFWSIDRLVSGGWNMAGFNMSVRKDAFLKIGGFDPDLKMGEDIDLSKKLRTVGKIGIDPSLVVYSSGRRFSKGFIAGVSSYAPWWISKVLLKRDKPFEFKDVRNEKPGQDDSSYFTAAIMIVALAAIFYFASLI